MPSLFDKFKFTKKPPQAKKVTAVKEGVKPAAKADARDTGIALRVLTRLHTTEKSARLNAKNQYVFAVALSATKLQVKDAIRNVYGARPVAVNMIRVKGKQVNFGRTHGRQKNWKKAVVTMPEGHQITGTTA